MTAAVILSQNVLARQAKLAVNLDTHSTKDLRPVARFWLGTACNKMRKSEWAPAVNAAFQDRAAFEKRLRELPEQEREILAIFVRYGGAVSGPLLECELTARGLLAPVAKRPSYYGRPDKDDPVAALGGKCLVVTAADRVYSHRSYYYSYDELHRYPDLVAQPLVCAVIEPAKLLPWPSSGSPPEPTASSRRTPAQAALDLLSVAYGLAAGGAWHVTQGGVLAKNAQNRLRKLMPDTTNDPLAPPAWELLLYEILSGLGAIDRGPAINIPALQKHSRHPSCIQCWEWVRAWLRAEHWQDGIGPTSTPVYGRRQTDAMRHAREILAWALGRVAHGGNDWLDLEAFLTDLRSAIGEHAISTYSSAYVWRPTFTATQSKENLPHGPERTRIYWLDTAGIWAANAILGTLFSLGLVERGHWDSGGHTRHCFRLTPEGRAVFGAPEVPVAAPTYENLFLTIQPNHDVTAYLEAADASQIWPLAQIARRSSAAGDLVRTFALDRESIYQALESGLAIDEIRCFLTDHSRTGLPANVARSLDEWGQRRESLVIRTHVSLGILGPGAGDLFANFAGARAIGDSFVLLPEADLRGHRDFLIADHTRAPKPSLRIDEQGFIHITPDTDAVTLAHLSRIADRPGPGWRITAESARRANRAGLDADEILGWLSRYAVDDIPAIDATAVRNWLHPTPVVLDNLLMLHIPDSEACAAMLTSGDFRAIVKDHIPPDWFVVRADGRAALEKYLTDLGFSITDFADSSRCPLATAGEDSAPPRSRRRGGKRSREKSGE